VELVRSTASLVAKEEASRVWRDEAVGGPTEREVHWMQRATDLVTFAIWSPTGQYDDDILAGSVNVKGQGIPSKRYFTCPCTQRIPKLILTCHPSSSSALVFWTLGLGVRQAPTASKADVRILGKDLAPFTLRKDLGCFPFYWFLLNRLLGLHYSSKVVYNLVSKFVLKYSTTF
jgi:hypothetical protein